MKTTNYKEELQKAMDILSKDGYMFIGQNTIYGGTSLFWTLQNVPDKQRIELPVFEDVQMGMSLGMALNGMKVCSIYPRMDFLICATNQLVNHLDKAEEMSDGQFKPKVIIRTCKGSVEPLMPGPQHNKDHSDALKKLLTNVDVIQLKKAEDIVPAYKKAIESNRSTILVEYPDLYNKDLEKEMKNRRKK